jgi:HAD superfamily hydrolase (TIGR01509 family)
MIRALLWDHDGVLVDTERLYHQATRELLAEVGAVLDDAAYRRLFLQQGTGAWHLARERGCSDEQVRGLKARRDARYEALLRQEDVLIPGVLPLLGELAPRVRMAIVTSSKRAHFAAIHERTGLTPHFEFVLAREDYAVSKPDPEPYLSAVARLGLAPSECLVIEDSERGLSAAKAAGLTCWVIPSELTRLSDFRAADRRFDQLSELRAALLEVLPRAAAAEVPQR